MADKINWPNDSQHLTVVGRTGTGKTHAGMWHLSGRNFVTKPWVILDTKGDEFIEEIGEFRNVKELSLKDVPGKKGLHIVRPLPHQKPQLDAFLWKIWARGRCGIFCDEGYMLKGIPAFDTLLTQGRSKKIPLIILAQRPAWISRFVFSEASFYQIFDLNDQRDWDTIGEVIPLDRLPFDPQEALADHGSLWYDVKARRCSVFSPVPPRDAILETFEKSLSETRVRI
jgi:hypothetical protein